MKANKQAEKRTEIYNKETGKFHSQCPFYQLGLQLAGGFAHLFQGAVVHASVNNLGGMYVFLFFSIGDLFSLFAR